MYAEPLLHPNAETVRTGISPGGLIPPIYSADSAESAELESGKRLVAGPFAADLPSSSSLPPDYTPPPRLSLRDTATATPSPPPKATEAKEALAELSADDAAFDWNYPVPYASQGDQGSWELGPAKGGKKPRKKAVLWEVIRSLKVPDDLPLLSTSLPAAKQTLTQIRHSHHQLAQMLATGTKQEECALITGYSPVYISILKTDPTFNDLVAYYAAQREVVFVDAIERMRSLGLSTLDELQARLEEDPTQFSNRELFEQAELMLVKPMAATRSAHLQTASNPANGTGIQLNVNFIGTQTPQQQPEDILKKPEPSPIIDVKAERIE